MDYKPVAVVDEVNQRTRHPESRQESKCFRVLSGLSAGVSESSGAVAFSSLPTAETMAMSITP